MKAYEMYLQDQVNGNELDRDASQERRQYYLELRDALRAECKGGRRCELLEAFGGRMDEKQLEHMYLLDAAAVWECYEGLIEGRRFTRDIGSGLPFRIKDRMLTWNDVERMAGEGTLPVAVVDSELWDRLTALLNYCAAHGVLKNRPQVDGCATLQTVAPVDVKTLQEKKAGKGKPVSGKEADALRSENEQLREISDGQSEQIDGLNRQLDALRSDNQALRSQIEQMQQYQETTRDYAVRAAGSILAGKNEEARALASQLEEKLQWAVQELERTVADCRALEESIARAQEKLEVDRAQLQALRQQEQEAARAVAEARSEREQAQLDASRAVQEQQAAQAELDDAMAHLSTETKTLRSLRQKAENARKACELTQRQIEGLS